MPDAASVVRNLLASLGQQIPTDGTQGAVVTDEPAAESSFPLLSDLLVPSVTVPTVAQASEQQVDRLLDHLPPVLLILEQQEITGDYSMDTATLGAASEASAAAAIKATMSLASKKALLQRVLHSPQFAQNLQGLSMALRDGGLPSIASALEIPVVNNGCLPGTSVPLGGGAAVKAFVEGVKKTVQDKMQDKMQDEMEEDEPEEQ